MKHKLYRLWKTFVGLMIGATGSILCANGIVYIYEIIDLAIVKKESISKLGYYDPIGFVSCEFAFIIGFIFIILGAYIIYLGAKLADRLTIWKK